MLMLQEKFPHDRVLQRMVKEEFKSNQPFRNPEEYDVYSKEREAPKKFYVKSDARRGDALSKDMKKYDEDLANFELVDRRNQAAAATKNNSKKANSHRLELHLHQAAWDYLEEINKRAFLEQGERRTVRTNLREIWEKLEDSPDKDSLLTRFPVYREPGSLKSQMPYPESFKRYFFRLVKCISETKKKGKLTEG